jgi:outer membrane protein TolC
MVGLIAAAMVSIVARPAMGRDLSLSDAVTLALGQSSAVRAARHDSLAAHLAYDAEKARRFPDINLTARSTFKDEVPTLDINMPPLRLQREIGSKEMYQADIEVSQPLFTGGLLSNGIRIEREQSLAEAAALRAEEMATVFKCRMTYLDAMATASALAGAQA